MVQPWLRGRRWVLDECRLVQEEVLRETEADEELEAHWHAVWWRDLAEAGALSD